MNVLSEGLKYERNSKWTEAINLYMYSNDSDDPEICERIAWCYSRLGRYDDSIFYINKIITTNPTARNFYLLGYQFYCKKEWRESIRYFKKALDLNPNYFVVLYRISYSNYQLFPSKYKMKSDFFWEAIKYLEKSHNVWISYDDEQKEYNRKTYFSVCFLHAKIIMDIENYQSKCNSLFQKALEIERDEDCCYNYSKFLFDLKEFKRAKEILPISNKYYVKELRLKIELVSEDSNEALEKLIEISNCNGKEYIIHFLSEYFLNKCEFEKSYKFAYLIYKKNKNHFKANYLLGICLYKLKQFDQATVHLNCAVGLSESNNKVEIQKLISEIEKEKMSGHKDDVILLNELSKLTNYRIVNKVQGNVISINFDKKFGFIKSDLGNKYFKLSTTLLEKKISIGSKVEFQLGKNNKGDCAIDILIID